MCGIIGYKGQGKAVEVVLEGLKKLEYRGYDSWGIAVVTEASLQYVKRIGKIGNVTLEALKLPVSNISLGHTRWATHGNVTELNSHPHFSNDKRIAVVHNGIVENYQELRDFLVGKGHTFVSHTDTEVIPHYISHLLGIGLDFPEAFRETCQRIEGCFAIVAIDSKTGLMAGGRRGSPLVYGARANEQYLASDVPAFLEHTNEVVYLNDDEMVVLGDGARFQSIATGNEIKPALQKITWTLEEAKKGSYPHYMMKEIREQGSTIRRAIEQDSKGIDRATEMITQAYGVFFAGCGTSYHACVSAAYEFSRTAKKHVNVVLASEFRSHENFLTNKTLLVAVSQSGETADLIDAVAVAKRHGVTILAITNVVGSTITRLADHSILMQAGPEICVLSTKSYTSQLAILLQLAYAAAGKKEEGRKLIERASGMVEHIIEENLPIAKDLAQRFKDSHNMFLIGRGLAYPSALEGALKIKEVSYIHAEGFAGGELKHGCIALIEKGVPVVALVTDETKKLILSNAMEIRSRGGYIIGMNEKENELYDSMFHVPPMGPADPIVMIIPLQLFAYHLAVAKGLDPDKPRNLAKSVTVK